MSKIPTFQVRVRRGQHTQERFPIKDSKLPGHRALPTLTKADTGVKSQPIKYRNSCLIPMQMSRVGACL